MAFNFFQKKTTIIEEIATSVEPQPESSTSKKDALLVLSGGMDSVTMLHEYAKEIALAVYFHYGSNHEGQEVACARYQADLLRIPLAEIHLPFMATFFKSSLLEGAEAIPEGPYAGDNMASTVIPFRNGVMLSIAAGIAESRGLKRVMIASHTGDHTTYPDCTAAFVDAMAEAVKQGTYANIQIFAPYTNITKSDIARRGRNLGVDYGMTYSCYRGGKNHCGKCATCIERHEALKAAGIFIID